MEGFINFLTIYEGGLSDDDKKQLAGFKIGKKKTYNKSGTTAGSGAPDIITKLKELYECDNKNKDPDYINSVNMYVKKKIAAKPAKTQDYKYRVLDTNNWNMKKNRAWIRTGNTCGTPAYDSNAEGYKPIGIDHGGKFQLVGLERLADRVFDNAGIDAFSDEKHREVSVYKLRTGKFDAVKGNDHEQEYDCQKAQMYASAFEGGRIPENNFIAHVINTLSDETLLCIDKIPRFLWCNPCNGIRQAFRNFKRFPTVLAQEMEQLRESGYVFARVKQNPDDTGEIIALPEEKARAARALAAREAATRVLAVREAAAQPVPDSGISGQSAATLDVSGQDLAGQAVPK